MRWRPIKTLSDDICPTLYVVLWNPCDGPHFLHNINANGCFRTNVEWRETGMFTAWAVMKEPASKFSPQNTGAEAHVT